jgi:hypothetical protein
MVDGRFISVYQSQSQVGDMHYNLQHQNQNQFVLRTSTSSSQLIVIAEIIILFTSIILLLELYVIPDTGCR